MGLILCSSLMAVRPYYIKELGIHIYSAEELCYVIYENPLLALEGFINENLLEFIKSELGLKLMALQLEKLHSEGGSDANELIIILKECDYYSDAEINKYIKQLEKLKAMPPNEYMKLKADYYYGLKLYNKAIGYYKSILKDLDETKDAPLMSDIYYNMGSSYAGMFELERAYNAYDTAYRLKKDKSILRMMYYLSLVEPVIELKERYRSLLGENIDIAWDKKYEECINGIDKSPAIMELDEINKKDPIRKRRLIGELLSKYKNEFRNMN